MKTIAVILYGETVVKTIRHTYQCSTWNALTQQFQSIAAATAASAMPAAAGWAKAAPAGAAPDSHDSQSGAHEAGEPARHADAQPARAAKKPSADPAADGAARKHKAAKDAGENYDSLLYFFCFILSVY